MTDAVHQPSHYIADNGMEAIDVVEAFFHDNAFLANVFKYIVRAGKKGDAVQDLEKARVYLDRELYRAGEGDRDPILDVRMRQEILFPSAGGSAWNTTVGEDGVIAVTKKDVPEEDTMFVQFLDAPVLPRVWDDMWDVPEGVVFTDSKFSDYWKREGDIFYFKFGSEWRESWERAVEAVIGASSFTEVVE